VGNSNSAELTLAQTVHGAVKIPESTGFEHCNGLEAWAHWNARYYVSRWLVS
jgi:hypothetical protein